MSSYNRFRSAAQEYGGFVRLSHPNASTCERCHRVDAARAAIPFPPAWPASRRALARAAIIVGAPRNPQLLVFKTRPAGNIESGPLDDHKGDPHEVYRLRRRR